MGVTMAGYYPKLKTYGISEKQKLLPELVLVHKVEARPWLAIPRRMCFHAKAQPQTPSFYPNMPSFFARTLQVFTRTGCFHAKFLPENLVITRNWQVFGRTRCHKTRLLPEIALLHTRI
jgi:hypothetical protein